MRQNVLAAIVFLADACHAGVHVLAAVDVLDGRFTEEEINVVSNVVRSHKVWLFGSREKTNKQKKHSNATDKWHLKIIIDNQNGVKLTVQPFRIVFQCAFEGELATARRVVVQIRAENDGVRFGELGIRTGIECGQVARIAALHPDGRRIIARVKRALGNAHAHTGDVFIATQMRQVGLHQFRFKNQ